MAVNVIGMHHIPIVKQPIPISLLHLPQIKINGFIQLVLQPVLNRRLTGYQRPIPKGMFFVIIFRHSYILRRLINALPERMQLLVRGDKAGAVACSQLTGTGNAPGVRAFPGIPLIVHLSVAGIGIMSEIHAFRLRAVDPENSFRSFPA